MIGKRMLEDLELIEKHGPQPRVWWVGRSLRRLQDYGLVTLGPSTAHPGGEVVLTEAGRQELARRRKP